MSTTTSKVKLRTQGGNAVVEVLAWNEATGEVAAIVQDSRSEGSEYGYGLHTGSAYELRPTESGLRADEILRRVARRIVTEDTELRKG